MKRYSNITLHFLTGLCVMCLLQSCSNSSQLSPEQIQEENRNYIINLFPYKDTTTNNKINKLSFEEAFTKSSLVLYTPHLKKIDSSFQQGAPVFYLYQASMGKVQKAPPNYHKSKKDTMISFLSQEELFKGMPIRDSVYLFLEPLKDYNLLRNDMRIQYRWIANAPSEQ